MINFDLPDFAGKNVVFVGKGREGLSFEKFINEQGGIKSFMFIDEKIDGPKYLDKLKKFDMDQTIVVKTPGCPGHKMPVPYTTATRVFFDCVKQTGAKSVGITGTKGKTTTASLMTAILLDAGIDARLCGNNGHPMLETLDNATMNTVFVVELSSYQLAELEVSPDVAMITNLFRDHTEYHGGIDKYWEAKRNIVRYMDENGALVFNPEDEIILHWMAESKAQQMPINSKEEVDMSKVKLIGDHNKLNYLMAKKAAGLFGIDALTCHGVFEDFEPVRHRLQPVRTVNGVTYVDDSIGSTPEATIAGIKALVHNKGPIGCILLGGVDRGYDFQELVDLIYRIGIPKIVFFPDTGSIIKKMLPEPYKPDIFETKSMEEAVLWARENTPSGSICLLSTAAPSTVLWKSFEEKGSLFQTEVLKLS